MKRFLIAVVLFLLGIATLQVYKSYDHRRRVSMLTPTPAQEFSRSIFAKDLGAPRDLVFDPKGTLLVSVPSKGLVYAIADTPVVVIENLNRPHGLTFFEHKLFIAETDAVATYDYDPQTFKATNRKKIVDLPGGGNHFTRTIGFSPDGKLYIAVGSSCNVCIEKDRRRAKILVANPDGSNLREYATGLRNSVFFTWDTDGRMWATEMGRDYLGDDLPPDEINIIEENQHYGWPYCFGKNITDKAFSDQGCQDSKSSHIDLPAHSAPLGLAFYQGDLIVAFHGSWNRTEPTGYKLVRIKLDENGEYEGMEDFLPDWLTPEGEPGRPVDIIERDGFLFVSDDKAGVIYRISSIQ